MTLKKAHTALAVWPFKIMIPIDAYRQPGRKIVVGVMRSSTRRPKLRQLP